MSVKIVVVDVVGMLKALSPGRREAVAAGRAVDWGCELVMLCRS